MLVEVDRSDEVLAALQEHGIDALVSVVDGQGLSILYKLHRKGLNAVCIPCSLENDIAATMVSFGFNSALSFTIEMLDRVREAVRSSRQIGVVEVQGEQAGWLALQAGIAAGADVILIPELPIDLDAVAEYLRGKTSASKGRSAWWSWPRASSWRKLRPAPMSRRRCRHLCRRSPGARRPAMPYKSPAGRPRSSRIGCSFCSQRRRIRWYSGPGRAAAGRPRSTVSWALATVPPRFVR